VYTAGIQSRAPTIVELMHKTQNLCYWVNCFTVCRSLSTSNGL
jgi:hypothetical protein